MAEVQIMSISQLVAQGWSRETLYRIAHAKNSPAFKSIGGGKIYFNVKKLEEYVEKYLK